MVKSLSSKRIWEMIILAMSLCLVSGLSFAAEFSADLVVQEKGGETMSGKIFVKGNKIRHEIAEEGTQQIVIIRPDKKVTWIITPDEKMYMEMPYNAENNDFEEWSPEKEKKAKFLAEETVSGVKSKKYEMREDDDTVYYWVSLKHAFPIKIEDEETIIEYRNLNDGTVDEVLFEVPEGYQKMEMPALPRGTNSEDGNASEE